jgi:predicted nuclease of predicted toxin-antitoxin system
MSIAIVIDMNLSPDWVPVLQGHGWQAVHWSSVGDPRAADQEIIDWALANHHVVFTHDLDLGTTLALTHAAGPSVLQVRGQDFFPTTWPRSSSRR